MSATECNESTKPIEDSASAGSSSSNGEPRLSLEQTKTTSFHWQGETHNVRSAAPPVFDAFIAEYVEEIVNVDRGTWSKFHRWRILNDCLDAGILELKGDELVPVDVEELVPTAPLSEKED